MLKEQIFKVVECKVVECKVVEWYCRIVVKQQSGKVVEC